MENGVQLLRLPWAEFDRRCEQTPGATAEQVHAFHSKLWRLHIDSQRITPTAETPTTATPSEDALQTSSRDPNPNSKNVDFKDRIRPGMAVSWSPPPDFKFKLDGLNIALALSPKDEGWLCAVVVPGILPGAYEISLWHQTVVESHVMEAEVILEYDAATRYYYIAV